MRRVALVAFAGVIAAPSASPAGGMFVPGAGPQAQARAGAFTVKADDPSAIIHNPAGLAKLGGTHILIGMNLVDFSLSYRRAGRYELTGEDGTSYEGLPYPEVENQPDPSPGLLGFQVVPTLVVTSDLGTRLRFAVGVFAPQGYPRRKFADSIDVGADDLAPAPQRYDIMEQEAFLLQPSLAVAYSPLPSLDVGVRAGWGFARVRGKKAVWAIRNYEEYPGRDSVFVLHEARDNFVPGFSLGAIYRPARAFEIGAAFHSQLDINARGEGDATAGSGIIDGLETIPVEDQYARCAPGGEVGRLKACIHTKVPRSASLGGRWVARDGLGRERADVELSAVWENWSAASDMVNVVDGRDSLTLLHFNEGITRHGFRDTLSLRLGGAYAVDLPGGRLIVRAGAAHDTAAAPLEYTRVDLDGSARTTLAGGLAWESGRFRVEAGGGVSLSPDRVVPQCRPPDGPSADEPGCDGSGRDAPVLDRRSPDPLQPKQGPLNQLESPFNAGEYRSGYVLLSLGVSAWF